jgi:hypothetical protein
MMLRYSLIESLELVVPYRKLHERRAGIALCSNLLYYLMTTLRHTKTLGEEYCNIE